MEYWLVVTAAALRCAAAAAVELRMQVRDGWSLLSLPGVRVTVDIQSVETDSLEAASLDLLLGQDRGPADGGTTRGIGAL